MPSLLTLTDFDTAARMFRSLPCSDSLRLLTRIAESIADRTAEREEAPFVPVVDGASLPCDFSEIRATFTRELSADELSRASGAIGYALRIYLAGEELSEPRVFSKPGTPTVVFYEYDSTKAQRSDPDVAEGLSVAASYIMDGSPVRQTNRAGMGTKGTRLVEGIGTVGVAFAVR